MRAAAKKHELVLEKVLLTHSHWDHIVDAAEFKHKGGLQVFVHAEDAGNVEVPGSDGLPLFFPVAGVLPDGYLEEGDEIAVGELTLRVLHTPGHSRGAVCFYIESEQTLLSGDTLFKGAIGNISFPTSNPELMRTTLRRLKELPEKTKVIPGHGEATTIGQESETLKCLD